MDTNSTIEKSVAVKHVHTEADDCVRSSYQAAHSEDIADLVRAMVDCNEYELGITQ
jgi:ubiquitin